MFTNRKKQYDLAVCAIFRNEANNLDEWLTFHSYAGVKKFYLYNDRSDDDYLEILHPWIRAGIVDLFNAEEVRYKQISTYNRCLRYARMQTKWLAFIDLDEFLWSPTGKKLNEVLRDYRWVAGIAVRWVLFGSSGHSKRPRGGALHNYTSCLPLDSEISIESEIERKSSGSGVTAAYYSGKSIVNPRRVFRVRTHTPFLYVGPLINEGRDKFPRRAQEFAKRLFWSRTTADILRINHYWSKSVEELADKVRKKYSTDFRPGKNLNGDFEAKLNEYLERARLLNKESDFGILEQADRANQARASLGLGTEK